MKDLLKRVEQNKAKIEAHGKVDNDLLQKINYKIRLDWNYYSNRMEGGTLTKAETRDVMVGIGVIKPIKDVSEMNGHDKVVLDLLSIGKGKMRISEKRIKEIHTAIMYEDDKDKQQQIGKWKFEPNEIINYKNEKVRFVEPGDVADKMHDLLNWLNAEIDAFHNPKKESSHPVDIAAKFHLEYVSIHPFYDGNGRTARILTNLILISLGYPPIIIKDDQKKKYYSYLGDIQSYGGDAVLFYDFIGERVADTQEIYLKVIAGESIEEEDDLDKRLKLLDQQFEAIPEENEVKQVLTNSYLYFFVVEGSWFRKFLDELLPVINRFSKYFVSERHTLFLKSSGVKMLDGKNFSNQLINHLEHSFDLSSDSIYKSEFQIDLNFEKFKKAGLQPLDLNYKVFVRFEETNYSVQYTKNNSDSKVQDTTEFTKNLLSNDLTKNEIKNLTQLIQLNITNHFELLIETIKNQATQ
jgi:Fic family protein